MAASSLPAVAQNGQGTKPVEYMKACGLYGEGFYYIPGTDTCLRVGGQVQGDYGWNVIGGRTPQYSGDAGAQDRSVSSYSTRHLGDITLDSRTQTGYGTLRSFVWFRMENQDQGTVGLNNPRAFVQWAGFTFGRTRSSSDVLPGWDNQTMLHQLPIGSDTSTTGTNQISYTWELGTGMALIVGAEERRFKPIANLSNLVVDAGRGPIDSHAGQVAPNPFVAFKVSQAWGRWDTSVTLNDVRANYYTATTPGFTACVGGNVGKTVCDYPSDQWGWAVASGTVINTPWIAPGDIFGVYGAYGVGASAYATGNNLTSPGLYGAGNNLALGVVTDAVYLNGTGLQLTTGWSAGAYFTHYWTPQFSSTVFGGHAEVSYNDTVKTGRWFCGGGGAAIQNVNLAPASAGAACDPSFGLSVVGGRTDWYPVPSFRLGVEVMYTQIDTAFDGQQITLASTQGRRPTGIYTAKDQGITSVIFRAQRQWAAGEAGRM